MPAPMPSLDILLCLDSMLYFNGRTHNAKAGSIYKLMYRNDTEMTCLVLNGSSVCRQVHVHSIAEYSQERLVFTDVKDHKVKLLHMSDNYINAKTLAGTGTPGTKDRTSPEFV